MIKAKGVGSVRILLQNNELTLQIRLHMLYRLIYYLFVSHFVRIAFIIKEHWKQMTYEAWLEDVKFYLETPNNGNYRKNRGKKTKPKRKTV